jgi:WD40 repeat protein
MEKEGIEEEEEEEAVFIDEDEIDEEIKVEVTDISILRFSEHTSPVYSIDVNPSNPRMFVSGGGDDRAFIWQFDDTCEKLFELGGHKETVSHVGFNFDGSLVACADEAGIVQIWNVNDGKLLHALEGPSEAIYWMQWHKKGNVLLVGSEDSTTWLFDAKNGKCLQVFSGHQDSVLCGTFTSNGAKVITGSDDCTVKVWDPSTAELVHTFQTDCFKQSQIHCIASKPDDPTIFLAGTKSGTSYLGSIKQKKIVGSVEGHTDSVECIDFNEKVGIFATGGTDGIVNVWDSSNLKSRCQMKHEDGVIKVKFDSDQKLMYTCSADNTCSVWDIRNGELVKSLTGHTDAVWDFAISNGKHLISCSDDKTCRIFKI